MIMGTKRKKKKSKRRVLNHNRNKNETLVCKKQDKCSCNKNEDMTKSNWLKKFIKKAYLVITVISTLSVFSVFLYASIGLFYRNTKSDNDIILEQVYNKLEEGEQIEAVKFVDLHGMGDESIVLVTGGSDGRNEMNRVLILEKLTNGFFSKIFNPFGFESEYITKYSYHNDELGWVSVNSIDYINHISSNITKDIVISYMYFGTTYGARDYIIIGYSGEDQSYHIIGTYPPVFKVDGLSSYDEEGKVTGSFYKEVKDKDFYESDSYEQQYSDLCVPIWLEDRDGYKTLMVVSTYKQAKECLINLYCPRLKDGKLVWDIFFSEFFDIDSHREISDSEKILDLLSSKSYHNYHLIKEK